MGATLSSRAQWTSVSTTGNKLDFTKSNEELLKDILSFVEAFPTQHPGEAGVVFKRPFVWETSLSPDKFLNLNADEYDKSNNRVASKAVTKDGDPLFSLSQVGESYEVRAFTFKALTQVLKCAGDKKLKEVQLCLEANQDPIATIMGPAYATLSGSEGAGKNALIEAHENLERERARGNTGPHVDELDTSFKLLLLLNTLDTKLLHQSVQKIGKEVRLNPAAVDSEVEVLQQFCGPSSNHCLQSLQYTSEIVFTNGCRAPPWRQAHGDICYLQVTPHDGSVLYITASTEGYYINGGVSASGEVNHERKSEVTPTLVALLKLNSKHFSTTLAKQEFVYEEGRSSAGDNEAVKIEVELTELNKQADKDVQEPTPTTASPQQRKKLASDQKKRPKETGQLQSAGLEPSQKWKALGVSSDLSTARQMSPAKPGSPVKKTKKTLEAGRIDSPAQPISRSQHSVKSRGGLWSAGSTKAGGTGDITSDSSSDEEEEEEQGERRPESNADLPSEYWQIQKLIKYLKGGNQTATVISLCCLLDFNLTAETSQMAIRDVGGFDLLINLLETDNTKCRIGALQILKEISQNPQTRVAIADLQGLPMMVKILDHDEKELKCLAAETIANVAMFRRARRIVRQNGGIRKLVKLLELPPIANPDPEALSDLEVARCGAQALWSCSKSRKNKVAIFRARAVPLLAKLLLSENENVLVPVVGTLQECASEPAYQELIRSEGMIEHLVRGLKSENTQLQMHCAAAIFKCAEEEATRSLVRKYEGLAPLGKLLKSAVGDMELLVAVTGAVWKCSKSLENVTSFKEFKAIDSLVALLNDQPEEVLINVVGAIGECARESDNRVTIRKAGGIPPMVQLLTGTNQPLLINVTKALGACALDMESMSVIDKQDGVRLLWSLLKSPNPEVQSCSAWAICPCIENMKHAGDLVRSFVGGLELIVGLLKSDNSEVLAGVCAAISKIAGDEENLAVITDHGVVPLLANLTNTKDDHLRRHLAMAIAKCCAWRNNRVSFGQCGAVAPLVTYLESPEPLVHQATALALHQLSKDPDNCITMHESGVVKLLLHKVGSTDEKLQEAAAGCIANIRKLALANEKAKYN